MTFAASSHRLSIMHS